MKLNINYPLFFLIILGISLNSYSLETARASLVKEAVIENGFKFASDLYINDSGHLASEGKTFFESPHLSLNGEISCSTCHRKDSGSSDGIPNAAGVRGYGEGVERLISGAKIVPRNSLALWGVGSKDFNTLFWDGKLVFSELHTISQFGSVAPSKDPLITAVHLPAVEIRETLEEDAFVLENKNESVEGVDVIYTAIVDNLKKNERDAINNLAAKLNKTSVEINFLDVATSIAAFIRDEFRIRETRLEKFMKDEISFTKSEMRGAEVFYGEGGCSLCHAGSNFTDQKFHTVPFPQLGFGKNGFGVDYGRYNATFNPRDLYKFRTPSLYNVEKTSPYGHSGSVRTLKEAVIAHYDPLQLVDLNNLDSLQRHELSKFLARSDMVGMVNFLTDDEVRDVVSFLKTLSF
jgi:cytochrome c peroxidase